VLELSSASTDHIATVNVDLLEITESSDPVKVAENVLKSNGIKSSANSKRIVVELVNKLIKKQQKSAITRYTLKKTIRSHILPLTNCAFNKQGDTFITGSYDRTCRVFDGETGDERLVLEGHKNVVYTVTFNYPICDRIVTGSFDKTAKLWDATTGKLIETFVGHAQEVVSVACTTGDGKEELVVATGSMDGTARIWVVGTNENVVLEGHNGEIVSVVFTHDGKKLLTSSFDMTARIWDVDRALEMTSLLQELRMGDSKDACIAVLVGHVAELSVGLFSFDGKICVTASTDRTIRIWDTSSGICMDVLKGHSDEVLDLTITTDARLIASASADASARVYDLNTGKSIAVLTGHAGEVSRVVFSPNGKRVLTSSSDKSLKIWDVQTGVCLQTLEGHQDEIFSCMFNYWGDRIISASKDNTCKVWASEEAETPDQLNKW
jgi:dynein assembly factor with WDR repeat domains 1